MFHRQVFAKKSLEAVKRELEGEDRLRRVLGPVALSSLGVGAIIGTGIFVLVGAAAQNTAGPALILSFVVAGTACAFAALCYAEFASMAPIAGSAYTYAYTTLGELLAWIIGWDLVLEYAVSSAAVAHGWSKYFQDLLKATLGYELPLEIRDAPFKYAPQLLDPELGPTTWTSFFHGLTAHFAPTGAYLDLPALMIAFIITAVLVVGIKESARFNSLMVAVKLLVVLFVIVVGAYYVNPANWQPFAPFGYAGVSFFGHTVMGSTDPAGKPLGMLAGAGIIFFAYIGFDAVSTHSEEARNPKRDVPIGILSSLIICTVLYIAVTAVLTGMVPLDKIDPEAPVSAAFGEVGLGWARILVSVGALTGITSVLLVTMLSQPRVLLAMARDGLLPDSFFGAVHPTFLTPWKSTILTGLVVASLGSLLPLDVLADLVNIGTLLAFVIVCGAVIVMRRIAPDAERPFRVPCGPLFPVLGILLCLILMFSLPAENWLRLAGWLALGLVIYLVYGRHHSHIGKALREEITHGLSPAAADVEALSSELGHEERC